MRMNSRGFGKPELTDHVRDALRDRGVLSVKVKAAPPPSECSVEVETTTGIVEFSAEDAVDAKNMARVARDIMMGKIEP